MVFNNQNCFFENSSQEDLLAFIEDSLLEEEEDLVTKVGREPMFIALKCEIQTNAFQSHSLCKKLSINKVN